MRSTIEAMLWEYTRRARSTFASILAAGLVLPAVTYGARMVAGPFDDPLTTWLEFTFVLFCLVGYNLAVLSMQGSLPGVRLGAGPERLYTLPLPNWRLAVGQLACGMAMIALLYLATAAVVNVVHKKTSCCPVPITSTRCCSK